MICCKQPKITAVAEALLGVVSSRGLTDGGVDNCRWPYGTIVRGVGRYFTMGGGEGTNQVLIDNYCYLTCTILVCEPAIHSTD